jgi:hypothetical protein
LVVPLEPGMPAIDLFHSWQLYRCFVIAEAESLGVVVSLTQPEEELFDRIGKDYKDVKISESWNRGAGIGELQSESCNRRAATGELESES